MITYAVIGHNESLTLARALGQALEAKRAGDHVVFVDSASSDGSAAVAQSLGVPRIAAPIGKGRAMEETLRLCSSEFICFIDGDIYGSSQNIPATLGHCARESQSSMVVGSFTDGGGVLSNTWAVYEPLIAALFPEAVDLFGSRPLTGFRCFRVADVALPLPKDFGVEAHLNLTTAVAGRRVHVCHIGEYLGRFLYKAGMGREIANAVLALAEAVGRVSRPERREWEEWLEPAYGHISTFRAQADYKVSFVEGLRVLASRSPPTVFRPDRGQSTTQT